MRGAISLRHNQHIWGERIISGRGGFFGGEEEAAGAGIFLQLLQIGLAEFSLAGGDFDFSHSEAGVEFPGEGSPAVGLGDYRLQGPNGVGRLWHDAQLSESPAPIAMSRLMSPTPSPSFGPCPCACVNLRWKSCRPLRMERNGSRLMM